jgi:adenylate cyclase
MMVQREGEIAGELEALGAKRIFTRIGINTTSAAVGFVGSSHLFNYTALGDGVNLASRMEGANKLYGTRILISESTAERVRDRFVLRKVDVLRVKGKRRPMAVYELLAERGPEGGIGANAGMNGHEALVKGYESAFARYQRGEWEAAEQELVELQRTFLDDTPTQALRRRIAALRQAPPAADWDGVYEAKEK